MITYVCINRSYESVSKRLNRMLDPKAHFCESVLLNQAIPLYPLRVKQHYRGTLETEL